MKYLSIVLYSLISWNVLAGTESGGGGGVVWIKSQPVLMDHFAIIDSVDGLPERSQSTQPILEDIHIRVREETSIPAFKIANQILDRWSALQMDVMSYNVKLALTSSTQWVLKDARLVAPPFYLAPSIPQYSVIEAVAYYHTLDAKVQIDRSIWNKMDLRDQSGLIIHESLRHVQLGFKHSFDDESLQRATAVYLNCVPTRRLNYYMFYVLNNTPEMADLIYGPFKKFFHSECEKTR